MNSSGVRHLYVHVPFCRARCAYCDFASEPVGPHQRAGRVEAYLEAVWNELETRGTVLADELSTVYLGGGTPTALQPEGLLRLVRMTGRQLAAGGELTVEANPGSLDEALLDLLLESGCNRISLGVQSFTPSLRRGLGRYVSQAEVEAAVALLGRRAPLDWSLDLVLGIPGQDFSSLRYDLERAVSAGPQHISLYDLTYTPAYDDWLARRGPAGVKPRAESFSEEAYSFAVDLLVQAGYRRYEVSNFALPGHESQHNQGYWRGEDYLGLGPSAVSTFGEERLTNPASLASYLAGEVPERESLTFVTRLFERAMLGLRTAEGVPLAAVAPVIDLGAWRRAEQRGLAGSRCGTLFLTQRGLDVSNALLAEVLVVTDQRAYPAGV